MRGKENKTKRERMKREDTGKEREIGTELEDEREREKKKAVSETQREIQ